MDPSCSSSSCLAMHSSSTSTSTSTSTTSPTSPSSPPNNSNYPNPSAHIQTHLYNALLHGRAPDVALHVRGTSSTRRTWDGVYLLHRVVLIQADFFKSLFEGGFRETWHPTSTISALYKCVTVTFDDPNVTRAAFEICIARLYGGGPALYVDARLQPTYSDPLTPSFPPPQGPNTTTDRTSQIPADNHHPATPRFLLSLVATGIYLSVPSVVAQAVRLILGSVGPYTVIRYLDFAIGKGIGEAQGDEESEAAAAAGLEHLRREPRLFEDSTTDDASARAVPEELECLRKECATDIVADRFYAGGKATDTSTAADAESDGSSDGSSDRVFMYGPAANKIGEAAVCWLCRWGVDMLEYEESAESSLSSPSGMGIPKIWRREGGMDARWACAVLSADAFFVRDEHARYVVARRVVELRRSAGGAGLSEEREWTRLFSEGIRYMHMELDELIAICRDVSPTTGTTYVPASVVQAAHWEQSMLRHCIFQRHARPPHASSSSLSSSLSSSSSDAALVPCYRWQYPVPEDTTSRIGMPAAAMASDQAATAGQHTADSFFGIAVERRSTPAVSAMSTMSTTSATSSRTWTVFPPMRFGVEFWGLDALSDGARLTSQTIWYAGSLFHVYVQLSHRQLGMYLKRLSAIEAIPRPSLPPPPASAIRASSSSPSLARPHSTIMPTRPTTAAEPSTSSSRPSSSPSFPLLAPPASTTTTLRTTPPTQPYRDPRESVRAHFTLLCASPTGNALTCFASAPDVFHVGRSWGWKSSVWQKEEHLGSSGSEEQIQMPAKQEVSLRATVVIGVV